MSEEYYQEQQQRNMPFTSPANQMGSAITTLTDPTNDIYQIELGLRNMMIDKDGAAQKVGEPLLNDLGISSVLGQVRGVLNTITSMSNLKNKNEVVMMVDFLADTLAKDLMMNKIAYNITNPTARDKIYFMALAPAYMHLNRPLEEGEKRFWKGTVQEIKQTLQSNNNQPGFFQKLLGKSN
jgi:hypothetical protein